MIMMVVILHWIIITMYFKLHYFFYQFTKLNNHLLIFPPTQDDAETLLLNQEEEAVLLLQQQSEEAAAKLLREREEALRAIESATRRHPLQRSMSQREDSVLSLTSYSRQPSFTVVPPPITHTPGSRMSLHQGRSAEKSVMNSATGDRMISAGKSIMNSANGVRARYLEDEEDADVEQLYDDDMLPVLRL